MANKERRLSQAPTFLARAAANIPREEVMTRYAERLGRRLETRRSLLLPHHDAVEAFGEGGAGALSGVEWAEGVDDGAEGARAGDVRMP